MTAFGYSVEDIEKLILPMADEGKEPTSSMGNDVTLAAFSNKPQRLFNYFRQQLVQVTNPPIDPIREELGDVTHRLCGFCSSKFIGANS